MLHFDYVEPTTLPLWGKFYDAVGVRVTELPVHPARLFKVRKTG
jgi:hypothetical protein